MVTVPARARKSNPSLPEGRRQDPTLFPQAVHKCEEPESPLILTLPQTLGKRGQRWEAPPPNALCAATRRDACRAILRAHSSSRILRWLGSRLREEHQAGSRKSRTATAPPPARTFHRSTEKGGGAIARERWRWRGLREKSLGVPDLTQPRSPRAGAQYRAKCVWDGEYWACSGTRKPAAATRPGSDDLEDLRERSSPPFAAAKQSPARQDPGDQKGEFTFL